MANRVNATLGARGFLKEEPRSAISKAVKRENRQEVRNLWLPVTVDWSYRANRFELGSRSDRASWLEEPCRVLWLAVVTDRCVVIGCLLIDLVILIDTYRSMIVRFASPATRGFLSPLLPSMSRLFVAKRNLWDQGRLMQPLESQYWVTQSLRRQTSCSDRAAHIVTGKKYKQSKPLLLIGTSAVTSASLNHEWLGNTTKHNLLGSNIINCSTLR